MQAVALGTGNLKKGVATSAIRALERQARKGRQNPVRKVRSFEEARAVYGAMGIGVQVQQANQTEEQN